MTDTPKIKMEAISMPIDIRLEDQSVVLPEHVQRQIDAYWDGLLAQGKPYRRGEVFTLSEVTARNNVLCCRLQLTDYAHHLATQHGRVPERYWCEVLYGAALLETTDGYFLFGEMGAQTSSAGRMQLVSGGLDFSDVVGERIDLDANVRREIAEELGLDCADASQVSDVAPAYLVSGGAPRFVAVVYRVKLAMTKEQVFAAYDEFVHALQEKGEAPELAEVVAVPMTVDGVRGFFERDGRGYVAYLPELLEREVVGLDVFADQL
jgi:8-oxo-dGTP pyrophosphatase MutT (NUDIX family)